MAQYLYHIAEEFRGVYASIDGTTTPGFEMQAAGATSDRWNVSAGYTFRTSRTRTAPSGIGINLNTR